MKKYCLLILIAISLTLTACSDDDGANNSATNNGNNGNNGTVDTGADSSVDASPDAAEENLSVLSIQPTSGDMNGGTAVSISGTGFADGATVWFGDTEATTTFVSKFQLDATSPAIAAPGTVDIIVENPDGEQATLTDSFEYTSEDVALTVGWCALQHPESTTTTVGTETEGIFGRVYVDTCSGGADQCQQVQAELGYGDAADDPTVDASTWTWTAATYNDGHTADDNDEYEATLTPDTAETFAYAYRFSVDGGTNWTYCDLDSTDNGFDLAQTGELTVEDEEPAPTVAIGWCRLQYPENTTTTAGTDSETIYGRVYSDGCTDGAAECTEISAQVGFGPETGDPTTDASAYTWTDATYNAGHTADNNDEHQAELSPQTAGTYTYAYRFSGDGGTTWTYCDFDDADGFQAANMGTLTVNE